MPVEDVFSITGRGTVATGRVERGTVKVQDTVEIVGLSDEKKTTVVTGVEMFRKLLDEAVAGDNIGALLRGVQRNEIERGQVLAAPGSIHPHTHFKGQVYVLKKEEGRKTYAVLQWIPTAVLLQNDGCNGGNRAAGRGRDGNAWRQRSDDDQADHADCNGRRIAVCNS